MKTVTIIEVTHPASSRVILSSIGYALDGRDYFGCADVRIIDSPAEVRGGEAAWQYYCKDNRCKATHSNDSDCICWHNEGAGPLNATRGSDVTLTWRRAPRPAPSDSAPAEYSDDDLCARCEGTGSVYLELIDMQGICGDCKGVGIAQSDSVQAVDMAYSKVLIAALKRLSFAAQTSGGTAGRDAELCAAIENAEQVMGLAALSKVIDAVDAPQQPAMQTLQDVAANAMTDFEVTRSIIHDCPALRLPQSFAEKLCAVSQIVVLKGSSPEIARFIADACNEKTDRLAPQAPAPTSDAVAQPVECEPLVLKGVGKINGDGWKDTTEIGQEVLAWNTELPEPYAAGQFPRIGNAIWSASTSQYDFTPLNLAEARSAIDSLIASARFEFLDEIANLRQQLAAAQQEAKEYRQQLEGPATSRAQQQIAAASLYVEVGYQYLVRDGFGHQFWHDKDFYNGSRATASRKIFALASTDAATNAGEARKC
jgi:hypothetical protein